MSDPERVLCCKNTFECKAFLVSCLYTCSRSSRKKSIDFQVVKELKCGVYTHLYRKVLQVDRS